MKRFAAFLDAILLTPSRNQKIAHMVKYFREAPDPDRGYALAVLTGSLSIRNVKASLLKDIVLERVDPVLFGLVRVRPAACDPSSGVEVGALLTSQAPRPAHLAGRVEER